MHFIKLIENDNADIVSITNQLIVLLAASKTKCMHVTKLVNLSIVPFSEHKLLKFAEH